MIDSNGDGAAAMIDSNGDGTEVSPASPPHAAVGWGMPSRSTFPLLMTRPAQPMLEEGRAGFLGSPPLSQSVPDVVLS